MSIARELTLQLSGAPRTKKNHGKVIKRGKRRFHVPSDAYMRWNDSAQAQFASIRAKATFRLPLIGPVNVAALFYRHANVGDAVGFYQALADALQEGGILENDRQIVQWDGSRLFVDKADPGIRLTITHIPEI